MTVAELIHHLQGYEPDQQVYIPDTTDNTVQICMDVRPMPHLGTESLGVSIPYDVILLPGSMV